MEKGAVKIWMIKRVQLDRFCLMLEQEIHVSCSSKNDFLIGEK